MAKRKAKAPAGSPGREHQRRPHRRPPVVVDPPARWPVALWVALTVVWAVGSPLFFVLFVAEGYTMLAAEEVTAQARRQTAWYLLGMVGCAWLVPLAGAVTALCLGRRVAAGLFAAVLLVAVVAVASVASPWEVIATIWVAFAGDTG